MEKLQKRFGIVELPLSARLRFQSLKQEPGESLEAWAERLVATSSRAFPGLPEDFVEQETITRFCMGCENREAGNLIYNLKPTSLEDAIEAVRHYQHNSQVPYSKPRRELRTMSVEEPEEPPREVRTSHRSEGDIKKNAQVVTDLAKRVSLMETEIGTLHKEVKCVKSEVSQLVHSVQELTTAMRKLGSTKSRSRTPSPGKSQGCFNCGDTDHFKAACPKLKSNSPVAKSVSFADKPLNGQGTST
ncbi:uncharacterized protein [Haliotis asinina]|uniref:uncharacterized protein n=1 Tax=Haliotis asinina TaxID=109174 RepID=UPI0035322372